MSFTLKFTDDFPDESGRFVPRSDGTVAIQVMVSGQWFEGTSC